MSRNVKLSGFKTTTAILLALPAHSLTASLPPSAPVTDLSVELSHPTGPAPLSTRIKLLGLTNTQWLNCVVKTTCGDTGAVFDVHPAVLSNAQLGMRDADVMYGPQTCHHYSTAGTFNGTVEVWTTAQAAPNVTIPFTVTRDDPDVFFAGTKTISVSPSGDFTGAPAGSTQQTTWPTRSQFSGDRRILLKGGDTITATSSGNAHRIDCNNFQMGSFGTGEATLNGTRLSLEGTGSGAYVFTNVEIEKGYDPATETGPESGGWMTSTDQSIQIHGMGAQGCDIVLQVYDNYVDTPSLNNFIVTNCNLGKFADYIFLLSDVSNFAVAGCILARSVDSLGGGHSRLPDGSEKKWGNAHQPIRVSLLTLGADYSVQKCRFFSNAGWTVLSGGRPAHQSCMRMHFTVKGMNDILINQNVFEGGFDVLSSNLHHSITGIDAFGSRIIIESNILVGSANTKHMLSVSTPTTVVRNNVLVMPNVPSEIGNGHEYQTAFSKGTGQAVTGPIHLVHNTIVDMRSTANGGKAPVVFGGGVNGGSLSGRVEAHNLLHAPNLDTPYVPHAPLDATSVYTAQYKGLQTDTIPLDTTYATAGQGIGNFRPMAGSSALGSVPITAATPIMDFNYNIRTGATTGIGAFHDAA